MTDWEWRPQCKEHRGPGEAVWGRDFPLLAVQARRRSLAPQRPGPGRATASPSPASRLDPHGSTATAHVVPPAKWRRRHEESAIPAPRKPLCPTRRGREGGGLAERPEEILARRGPGLASPPLRLPRPPLPVPRAHPGLGLPTTPRRSVRSERPRQPHAPAQSPGSPRPSAERCGAGPSTSPALWTFPRVPRTRPPSATCAANPRPQFCHPHQ